MAVQDMMHLMQIKLSYPHLKQIHVIHVQHISSPSATDSRDKFWAGGLFNDSFTINFELWNV